MDPAAVHWTFERYEDLARDDLHDALALRQLVFVVEQACAYLDIDGKDPRASHLLGRDPAGILVAYARLLAPGVTFAEASIGRIVTHPSVRGRGVGRALVREAVARIDALFGGGPIRIGAQQHLERFYGDLGFAVASKPYVDDGILHVEMLRVAQRR